MKEYKFEDLFRDIEELRIRLSLEGSGETYEEDHLNLDKVLDVFDFINDNEKIKKDFEIFINERWS